MNPAAGGSFLANASFDQMLPTVSMAQGNVEVAVTWTTVPVGDMAVASIIVQKSSATTYTYLQLIEATNTQLTLKLVRVINGTASTLGTASASIPYPGSEFVWLRLDFTATAYKARAWPDGLTEPQNWQLIYSPPGPPRVPVSMSAGQAGLRAQTFNASSPSGNATINFENFRLQKRGFSLHFLLDAEDHQDACITYVLGVSEQAA